VIDCFTEQTLAFKPLAGLAGAARSLYRLRLAEDVNAANLRKGDGSDTTACFHPED